MYSVVERSMASSPYAVLFIPRRFLTEDALVQVLRDHFAMYLLLESDVARELAPQAAAFLRDFVGERAWQLGARWQSLNGMLKPSELSSLTDALALHAVRWLATKFSARVLAQTMEAFPDFVGRHALSQEDCHRLLFACDLIPA